MALSFEESKKQLAKQMATPAIMRLPTQNDGIMTLDLNGDDGAIAAYSEWTKSYKYDWYDEYSDENASRIDSNKNVTVHDSQINISQEENSQFIPFEMSRYYDGFDLMNTEIWIHYLTSDNYHGSSRAINVSYDTATIKFGWLVDGKATHIDGVLKFEIRAIGVNSNGDAYVWKSKPFEKMNVLKSLINDNRNIVLDDTWVQELVTKVAESVAERIAEAQVGDQVIAAENAANRAEIAATNATSAASTAVANALVNYSTTTEMQEYVAQEIANADIDNKLTAYAKTEDVRTLVGDLGDKASVVDYVNAAVDSVDVTEQLVDYALKSEIPVVPENVSEFNNDAGYLTSSSIEGFATEKYVQEAVAAIDVSGQLVDYAKIEDVNTAVTGVQAQVDTNKSDIATLSGKVSTNEANIGTLTSNATTLGTKITDLETTVNEMADQAGYEYYATYGKTTLEATGEETENVFTLYEVDGDSEAIKSQFVITGGSGGSASATTLTVTRVTSSPLTITTSDKAIIQFNCTSYDGDGETVDCSYVWKTGGSEIMSGSLVQGLNTFDLTDYVMVGEQKFTLTVTDEGGSMSVKTWTVKMIEVSIKSNFDDSEYVLVGNPVDFTYTPKGAISKTVHFKLDGKELEPVITTASDILQTYPLPAQTHGAHLLEVWITVDEMNIETPHIYRDIIWRDPESEIPIIGCIYRYDYYGAVDARQYNNIDIVYTVYDKSTDKPIVTRYVDGASVGKQTLEDKTERWSYKPYEIGEKTLVIECGTTSVEIKLDVKELGIDIEPAKVPIAFDFNPVGKSNSDTDRIWKDSNTNVAMTVSNNFDWVNGGYQKDSNGDQYFCVKAGTTATINYNLFGNDPRQFGKEFKVIFKTENVRKRDTSFITCMDGGIGLDMKVEDATVYYSDGKLQSLYCEDEIIEYEFNIRKYNFEKPLENEIPLVMTYEDGTPSIPSIYNSNSSFKQSTFQPITIGSQDCDILIYRMRVYTQELTDKDIVNNFILDARNADDMIVRYDRNKIYTDSQMITTNSSGRFSIDALMKAAPDLRYIMLECPQFTNDKDNKIDGCTVYHRYPNGRPEDNWTCTGMRHRGQGTSSNDYGYSGRNIDLCMDRDTSLFTWTDKEGKKVESSTITLTDTSVPTDYLNIKVNIASSENANNAEMARRFNEYQPFKRYAKMKDDRVRDTMEFYNCVVFIRETSPNTTQEDDAITGVAHREFADTNWHFYGIGNVGDSKKTDDTRVNDKNDPKECVVEIADVDVPLASFPVIEKWEAGDRVYDLLHSEYTYDDKDGSFKTFGAKTYEFRYEMKDITPEQREVNINAWRNLYKFIVMSTEEEFKEKLKDYFVVDTALYYYLFTERYTMVDNRAKNSFWHYGKVYISNADAIRLGEDEAKCYLIDDEAAAINDGYRWDLTFGYDFDTALGIDNVGKLAFSYGKEDVDYAENGEPVFRAHDSTFFCRIRDLFKDELVSMFQDRDNAGAWSSSSLISQWDNSQVQFPEELWRKDFERKYWRTYLGSSVDNSFTGARDDRFLKDKFLGRKKYQRRMFEINQDMYFSTKYFGKNATDDRIYVRGKPAPAGSTIEADYTLKITPYSNMYVGVKYGSSDATPPKNIRATAGVQYTFTTDRNKEGEENTVVVDLDVTAMDFVYMYGASYIQAIDNLSKWYVEDNNFAPAIRLQRLVLGSSEDGYYNPYMKRVGVLNNKLLEYLDLQNISGLNTVIDVSGCGNLKELYAQGTSATGATFANGGMLQKAYLPKIISLSMKNLSDITDKSFVVEGYDNLESLTIENTPNINSYEIIDNAPKLKALRLTDIQWDSSYNIQDCSILNRLLEDKNKDGKLDVGGINDNGFESDVSVLTGYIWVAAGKDREIAEFNELWPYLTIEADAITQQFEVTFINDDGTVLDKQYVDAGLLPIDPVTRDVDPIAVPTKESTISTDYEYDGWDTQFVAVWSDQTIKATYKERIREYTVEYVANNKVLQTSTAPYGSIVLYDGEVPTYTAGESNYKYYLFDGWDKSGYVDGDKTINAIFDSCTYVNKYFDGKDLSTLRPVEIYMMTKLSELGAISASDYVSSKDSITMKLGNDFSYADIEERVLIDKKVVFTGANHIDTGEKLFSEDRDFVLAIDYSMSSENSNNNVFAQCYSDNGMSGFRLWYNSGVKLGWGSSSTTPSIIDEREVVVIRHIKGENGVHVYASNTSSILPSYIKLDGNHAVIHNSTLVFGCSKSDDGTYEKHAIGSIYWSKLWYADLGDDICRQLVAWTHETINFEMCGFKRYFLSNNASKRTSMSFLAANALARPMMLNNTNYTTGGWASATLNEYLNNRLYNAIPVQWRQLLKQVSVKSSIGDQSFAVSSSNCYIFIPAVIELDPSKNIDPYINEGESIDYLTTNSTRVCTDESGNAVVYWTRSPNISYAAYQYSVGQSGSLSGYNQPTSEYHIRIMISM